MALRIGLMGGIPTVLGGGGLEMQIEDTHRELERLGHAVARVEAAAPDTVFDLVHAFGSEPDNWQRVRSWYRRRVPLVVTPVISISTRWERLALRAAARIPGLLLSGRMRRELLDSAEVVVALTQYERELILGELGIESSKVRVIGNGVNLPAPVPSDSVEAGLGVSEGFVLMVGRVTPSKRQAAVIGAMGGRFPTVVAGDLEDESAREEWEALVARSNAVWLGAVDRAELAYLYESARVLVHLSTGEVQSLAVLEALSTATPVIASDIPAHRELAGTFGEEWVRIVEQPAQVAAEIEAVDAEPLPALEPVVPTARSVAAELTALYESISGTRRVPTPARAVTR